jgi:hypothetical protein
MAERLAEAGLDVERRLAVSTLRVPLLKRLLPARLLAAVDGLFQWTGRCCPLAPSVFCRARAGEGPGASVEAASTPLDLDPAALFYCPACQGDLRAEGASLVCLSCAARWQIDDGIYDFKSPSGLPKDQKSDMI